MHRSFPRAAASFLLLTACSIKVGDLGELTEQSATDPSTGPAGSTGDAVTTGLTEATSGSDTDTDTDTDTGAPAAPVTGVDIVFIIDNSGSMAEEQQRLGAAIVALVDPLIAADLDLRIAVTTTDAGSPRCQTAVTKPENGEFQARSCRARIPENEWKFIDDDYAAACTDICPHETLTLSATVTAEDPQPKSRPWIEWGDGGQNIDVPLADALGCMLPQGVAGCGFESQLESMYLALGRTQDPADPAYGFLRTDADLLVVIVTDEMDCSYVPEFKDIFTPNNKVFWNSPDDPTSLSSVCWRAGMQCSGGPGTYDDCVATDHDASGGVTQDPTQAVLQPLSRYQGVLSTIVGVKQAAGSAGKVRVAAIAGVPVGYPQVPLVFADAVDPLVQDNFGIGPGCQVDDAIAAPPGRIRELVEQTAPLGPGLFSICEDDFAGSLAAIAATVMD